MNKPSTNLKRYFKTLFKVLQGGKWVRVAAIVGKWAVCHGSFGIFTLERGRLRESGRPK
jgi:hypothetical protein